MDPFSYMYRGFGPRLNLRMRQWVAAVRQHVHALYQDVADGFKAVRGHDPHITDTRSQSHLSRENET